MHLSKVRSANLDTWLPEQVRPFDPAALPTPSLLHDFHDLDRSAHPQLYPNRAAYIAIATFGLLLCDGPSGSSCRGLAMCPARPA